MFKILWLSIILLLWNNHLVQGKRNSVQYRSEFVNDFLEMQANSKQVLIHFCTNKNFNFHFSQIISESSSSHTFINNLEPWKYWNGNLVILLEAACMDSIQFLIKGASSNLLTETNYWLVFHRTSNTTNTTIPSDLYLPINSNVFTIFEKPKRFNVKTLFKYSRFDTKFTEEDIGKWTQGKGFDYFRKLSLPHNRSDLMGTPMRVSFYYSYVESLSHKTDFRQIEKDNILKLNYILLNAVAEYLNATYVTKFSPNYGLNFDKETDTFEDDSVLGDVQRGKADIIGIHGWVEKNRLRFFRYLGYSIPDSIKIVYRAPSKPLVQNIYLMPFDMISWYCIGSIFGIGVAILFVILIQEKQMINLSNNSSTIVDIIMVTLSALLQKSWDIQFRSWSGRLSLAVTYISFLVLFNAYSASIIVFLQGTSETIKSFEDLYRAKYDIGVQDVTYNRFYFLVPNEGTNEYWRNRIYREIISKVGENKFFLPIDKGVEQMHSRLYGFHSQVSQAHYIINKIFTQAENAPSDTRIRFLKWAMSTLLPGRIRLIIIIMKWAYEE